MATASRCDQRAPRHRFQLMHEAEVGRRLKLEERLCSNNHMSQQFGKLQYEIIFRIEISTLGNWCVTCLMRTVEAMWKSESYDQFRVMEMKNIFNIKEKK
ncbi:hypothetical protein CEXT_704361 [Caerostris extrusa]|uniref:Uncharacterized protein n=1 Tax=Caerostris extrusa TaxID=172846 RepID=A0AAV4Y9P8_CAEEX|nr:hypothetical protein CEXT_704361 [Caerostris extrusa]